MAAQERPLGIKTLRGCGRDYFPYLVRDGDKIFCMNREREVKGGRRFDRFELSKGAPRQAVCAGSECVYQVETEALEFCHSTSYLQHLREKSSPI